MLSVLKKIVVKLGGIDTSEKNHLDTFTENKIINTIGDKIATCSNGGIWIKVQELSDYHFLNVTIVGKTNFKTLKGIVFQFITDTTVYELHTDTKEIASVFSNVSNRWITEISFDITEIDFDKMLLEGKTIEVKNNKKQENFTVLK